MNEIWRDIVGYEKLYQISNLGRVKSLAGKPIGKYGGVTEERILKALFRCGYAYVALCNEIGQKNHLIHRLVAFAFIPPVNGKDCVNHIDGDKMNNKVENLEWTTPKENMAHALQTGLRKQKKVQCIKTGSVYTILEAAAVINISSRHLYDMVEGEQNNWTTFKLLES